MELRFGTSLNKVSVLLDVPPKNGTVVVRRRTAVLNWSLWKMVCSAKEVPKD